MYKMSYVNCFPFFLFVYLLLLKINSTKIMVHLII